MQLHGPDYLIILLYFVFVIGIGAFVRRKIKTSSDFLMSGRSIPLWIASLSFISANLGAQEVIGMVASGAKYGLMTNQFYWLGAVLAMCFLGVFMMPFYYGSRARSVPEYLALRFDEKTRGFNALTFAAMTIFSSGISLYALAKLLEMILQWNFQYSICIAALVVMIYTLLGGLTSAVYNEVLQFFLIILGIAPVVFLGLHDVGGWSGIKHSLAPQMTSVWKYMGNANENKMGVSLFSMCFGLGFVLAFGYWCTDFLVVQRAMVARNMSAARRAPIIAAIPKMFMPFIVVLPGIIAAVLLNTHALNFSIPLQENGTINYNMTLPAMISHYYPTGLLGVGITALIASFMSGMAGNVTAFNTIWTFDIYQSYIRKNGSDHHYLIVGKLATVIGVLLSVFTAYLAASFNNIMDFLQLIFGFVNAPLFATFFLGMFWKRTTSDGAFWGLIAGTASAALTQGLTFSEGKGGWITPLYSFRSSMGQAFTVAAVAWITCFIATIVISLLTKAKPEKELHGLVYRFTRIPSDRLVIWYKRPLTLSLIIIAVCIGLNIIFW
jgi:SSS family solute:Na+ symporter